MASAAQSRSPHGASCLMKSARPSSTGSPAPLASATASRNSPRISVAVAGQADLRDEHADVVEAGGAEAAPPRRAEPARVVVAGDGEPALEVGAEAEPGEPLADGAAGAPPPAGRTPRERRWRQRSPGAAPTRGGGGEAAATALASVRRLPREPAAQVAEVVGGAAARPQQRRGGRRARAAAGPAPASRAAAPSRRAAGRRRRRARSRSASVAPCHSRRLSSQPGRSRSRWMLCRTAAAPS